jgi:methyl-accepting chemotaxis protein
MTAAVPHDLQARQAVAVHAPTGGLAEFFRYHGLWSPGVRLFRRIGFRAKAVVISAVFMAPIGLLAWNYFSAQATAIEFSAKERHGVVYAQALMPVLKVQQQQRLATLQAAAKGGGGDVAALRDEADRLAARLAQVDKAVGAELGTGKALASWQQARQAAGQVSTGADAVFTAHTAAVTALLDLLGVATDGSNLTLDPDIDTYYLMDAAMFRLPVMVEAAAQIRGLGQAVLSAGSATPAQARRLIEQATLLSSHQAAVDAGLAKAVAYNADVAKAVGMEPAQAAAQQLLSRLDATVLRSEGVQGDAAAHVALANEAIEQMLALAARSTGALDQLIARRVNGMESARNLTAVVMVLALLLAAYLFVAFRKVLEGGLKEVAFHIDAMRDGNLTTQPRAWGHDEAAGLMHTLAQMQESLRRIVTQVRGASDALVSSSTEIAHGAVDLHTRTEQSAANLEETASAMEQIAATVKSNTETLDEATRLSGANAEAAEDGGRIIGQVMETMQAINASSARIGDIIGTIDGIAFQTNILALNAAVEAARAGEQGRGFAVVASEVRALALRSSDAAREIKSLITASVEQVEGGVQIAQRAGASIASVLTSATRVRQLLSEAAVGAREQNLGVAQSAKAVQELDNVTQQNAALVEQTAAAVGSLKDQAQGLAGEVAQFRLPALA